MKLPAYKAGHQKGNSNLSWGNISPKPPERAIHPRAQHGVFWQNCIKARAKAFNLGVSIEAVDGQIEHSYLGSKDRFESCFSPILMVEMQMENGMLDT